jgi:hypothetical protein
VLTDAQVGEFERTGILKLEAVFDRRNAERMQNVVWNELEHRHQILRDDPTTWNHRLPTGLKSTKRSAAFGPICGPPVVEALDTLLGMERWLHPRHFGNVLVTMPNVTEWRVPHKIWHSDFPPTLPHDRLVTVKLWALFDDVDAGGAGTPQLAGSHVAFARYLTRVGETDYKRAKFGFLRSHPWLQALTHDDGGSTRNGEFMDDDADIDGLPLRVIECTGRAGDVYITHPWVFHSIATNATSRPRLMRSLAIRATPVGYGLPEAAEIGEND